MRITWVSPWGAGWSIAHKLRAAGNKVVYYNPSRNKNGAGLLPETDADGWYDYARKSDLVVMDGVAPSSRRKRSWDASNLVKDLEQLRRAGVPVIGTAPGTIELLSTDPRYQRKMLTRLGVSSQLNRPEPTVQQATEPIALTVSLDPDRRAYLVFRHRHLLGDSIGPEPGNLGDVVVPIADDEPLVMATARKFDGLLDHLSFRGYLNLDIIANPEELTCTGVDTGFLYPAVFCQIGDLLARATGRTEELYIGLALTILNFKGNEFSIPPEPNLLEESGFFCADLHRDLHERELLVVHGAFIGASVGVANLWPAVESKVYQQATRLVGPNLGFRLGVGRNVLNHLNLLKNWGYLK